MLPCFLVRREDGKYQLHMEEPIFAAAGDEPDDLMRRLVPVLEEYVRRYPEQWLIVHRYWGA